MPILLKLFQTIAEEGTFPNSFYKATITLIPKITHKKRNLQANVTDEHRCKILNKIFSSVQSLSHIQLFVTPWTAVRQASLSFTVFWSSFRFMSIESVMLSNDLILCLPLLLLPSIFLSIRVFSNELTLPIKWPKVFKLQLQHQSFQ